MSLAPKRPIDRHVGERVRALREHRRLSLEELASRVGVTPAQLGAYESGERMAPRTLYALAEALSVPLARFFIADQSLEQPVADELARFASPETTELLRAWQRLAVDARRRALVVVRAVAEK
jgi:transcriptional regulator with XRE-family HTH domain